MVFTTTFCAASCSASWDLHKAGSLLAQIIKSLLEFKKGFLQLRESPNIGTLESIA